MTALECVCAVYVTHLIFPSSIYIYAHYEHSIPNLESKTPHTTIIPSPKQHREVRLIFDVTGIKYKGLKSGSSLP